MFDRLWILGASVMTLALGIGLVFGRVSSRKTPYPRERVFVLRTCLLTWLLIGLFVASTLVLSPPYRYILPAALLFVIPALHYRWSMRRHLIRRMEEREHRSRH